MVLSAPLEVLRERLRTRTTDSYGETPAQRADVQRYVHEVEPLLRRGATLVLDGRRPGVELAEPVAHLLR